MPLSLNEPVLPVDGRQSETALLVARGTRRFLRALGYATVAEMGLRSGRRADLVRHSVAGFAKVCALPSQSNACRSNDLDEIRIEDAGV